MKIELIYNPIQPSTIAYIDGVKTKSNDIYGFLYPVRFYTLQTWLYADGSWTGLVKQLYDLAKGEEINLTFSGREIDYKDLQKALEGHNGIELSYKKRDLFNEFDMWEKELNRIVSSFDLNEISEFIIVNEYNNRKADFFSEDSWLKCINSTETYENAVALKGRNCFYVTEEYLDSYPRLEMIARLNRGMKTPKDAICCVFKNEKTCNAFVRYAEMFPKFQFRFVLESNNKWKDELYNKYGLPIIKGLNYIYYQNYYKYLREEINKFIDKRPQIEKEYELMLEKKQDFGCLNGDDNNKFNNLKKYRHWIKKLVQNKQFTKFKYMVDGFDSF